MNSFDLETDTEIVGRKEMMPSLATCEALFNS